MNWQQKFKQNYPEHNDVEHNDVDYKNLRLILGVGRSGTSWLNRFFSRSFTDIRSLSEPLFKVKPTLPFSSKDDHLAIQYLPNLISTHPLIMCYELFLNRTFNNWNKLGISNRVLADNPDWKACLVKETHSLLASQGLVDFFKCPTILLIRNPLYVVDSIFDADGENTIYLNQEFNHIKDSLFQKQILKSSEIEVINSINYDNVRLKKITEKLVTIFCIQKLFINVNRTYKHTTRLVEYENLCRFPEIGFKTLTYFFGYLWTDKCEEVLNRSISVEKKGTYSTCRIPKNHITRDFKFLKDKEVNECQKVLKLLKE